MKTLIGGAIAALLGFIGLAIWFDALLQLLAGILPVGLLVGGALALYLGFDELKNTWSAEGADSILDKDQQIAALKDELERLKKS